MIAGYVLASVAVLAIIAAVLVHLWPTMRPYQSPPMVPSPDESTVELSLSRLRDTGGFIGGVHVDCLRARASGDEICEECVPMLRGRILTEDVT